MSDDYGDAQLWELACELIETHGADKVTREVILAATPSLDDHEVGFVYEIVQGEL
jgi:hypothetical protein